MPAPTTATFKGLIKKVCETEGEQKGELDNR
jgi:hypothetical protein